jgi:hypothetical protein
LEDREAPWYELLHFRYGSFAANFLLEDGKEGLKNASIWWRDIWKLGSGAEGGWFGRNISSCLGDGNDITFWKEKWFGPSPLRDAYPDLFVKTENPNVLVSQMGSWIDNSWIWSFEWKANLITTEIVAAQELLSLLHSVQPKHDERDRRKWVAHTAGFFSVKSAYSALENSPFSQANGSNSTGIYKDLWSNNVPSKVSIFGWRLLIERLPTRDALYRKGIITNNHERSCVFCSREVEDIHHVFFNCYMSQQIWNHVFRWLGTNYIPFVDIQNHFTLFGELFKGSKFKRYRQIIWLATTWSIWRKRNNIIFRGDFINVSTLLDQIIYISWYWYIGRGGFNSSSTFSDWCNNPLDCFLCFLGCWYGSLVLHSTFCS